MHRFHWLLLCTPAALTVLAACSSAERSSGWAGSIDPLASGQVVVRNPAEPLWTEDEVWRITEDLRIGSAAEEGPELFGQIVSFAVGPGGELHVLDRQANELRIFNPDGSHLATVGRQGGGPGEFESPMKVSLAPNGEMWVPDPQNTRVSRFSPDGRFLGSEPQPGGFVILPWPGGFDGEGRFYSPVPLPAEEGSFSWGLVRHTLDLTPLDTLPALVHPVDHKPFQHNTEGGSMHASVPFAPGLKAHLSPGGTRWALYTGEYRLMEVGDSGDTLRTVTRVFEPLPVTAAERDSALATLEWFTRQGGSVDPSRLPSHKEGARDFFFDDEDHLWVMPVAEPEREGRVLDVFDPVGRYLGRVDLPFKLGTGPLPIVKDSVMYAVTMDELGVAYVVRATIQKGND